VYIRTKTIAACIGYSASCSQNLEEQICYKMVYNTLPLSWVN